MNMNKGLIILSLFLAVISQSIAIDTLSHYSHSESKYLLNEHNIVEFTERFELNFTGEIVGLKFKAVGKMGSKGQLKIYGNELSDVIPTKEYNKIGTLYFEKSKDGDEWIEVNFENPVEFSNEQIFVSIDFKDNNSKVYTDKFEKESECISVNCNTHNSQLIKDDNNQWKLSSSSFLIDLIIERDDYTEDFKFTPLTVEDISEIDLPLSSVSIYDVNNDGFDDILTNQYLLINNNGIEFNKSELIDTNSNCLTNIIINDNNDIKIVSLIKNSDVHYIRQITNQNNKLTAKLDSIQLDYNFKDIQSYSIKDIDGDDLSEIIIIDNNEQSSEIIGLRPDIKGYEVFFNQTTSNVNSISFNPTFNNSSLLYINYISGNVDVLRFDESGMKVVDEHERKFKFNTDFAFSNVFDDNLVLVNQDVPSLQFYTIDEDGLPNIKKNEFKLFDNELYSPLIEDFNNDGLKDIVLSSRCDCRKGRIYYQSEDGKFQESTLYSGFNEMTLGPRIIKTDFNNDGKIDIVSADDRNDLTILMNNSNIVGNFIQFEYEKEKPNSIEVFAGEKNYRSIPNPNGRSFNLQEPSLIHIGIADNELIDSAIVASEEGTRKYSELEVNTRYQLEDLEEDQNNTNEKNLICSPNPFKNRLQITFDELDLNTPKTLRIYNQNGLKVFEQETLDNSVTWDARDKNGDELSSGVYITTLEYEGSLIKNKVIKID